MHYEQRAKDRMVTDEHPGYDARAHWCGEDHRFTGTPELPWLSAYDQTQTATAGWGTPRPNLRRVRAWAEWAQAASRIVTLLAVFALGVLVGAYAESAVWK